MSASFEKTFQIRRAGSSSASGEENGPEGIIFHSLLCKANICGKRTDIETRCSKFYTVPEGHLLSPPKVTELKDAIACFHPSAKGGSSDNLVGFNSPTTLVQLGFTLNSGLLVLHPKASPLPSPLFLFFFGFSSSLNYKNESMLICSNSGLVGSRGTFGLYAKADATKLFKAQVSWGRKSQPPPPVPSTPPPHVSLQNK